MSDIVKHNHVIAHNFSNYFIEKRLIYDGQYGFWETHSTELTTLNWLHWIDWVVYALDEKLYPVTVLMDLSKVFDTLDHKILLNKWHYNDIKVTH